MSLSHHTPLPTQISAAQVVMTCGVSGSGKTRLARRLREEGFALVSTDRLIWARHGENFPALASERKREIFMAAAEEVDAEVSRLLAAGRRVVVDATFCKRRRRDAFRAICASRGVTPVLVYLESPRETLLRRLATRHDNGPDDQRVSVAELDSYLAHFERPEADEPYVTVSDF